MADLYDAPAYQEYAANMLASFDFRMLSFEARGLLYTMKLECWVNKKLPNDLQMLSKILGNTVTQELLDSIMSFFEIRGEDLICPDLEIYRNQILERRKRMSAGGKKGAKKTNNRVTKQKSSSKGKSAASSKLPRRRASKVLVEDKLEQPSLEEVNLDQSMKNSVNDGEYNFLNPDGSDPITDLLS